MPTVRWIIALAAILVFAASCKQNRAYPEASSELAALMRNLEADAQRARQAVLNGKPVSWKHNPEQLYTAEPTKAGVTEKEHYKAYAAAYIQASRLLQDASVTESAMRFNALVDACIHCHTSECPGPVVRIRKLYLSDEL